MRAVTVGVGLVDRVENRRGFPPSRDRAGCSSVRRADLRTALDDSLGRRHAESAAIRISSSASSVSTSTGLVRCSGVSARSRLRRTDREAAASCGRGSRGYDQKTHLLRVRGGESRRHDSPLILSGALTGHSKTPCQPASYSARCGRSMSSSTASRGALAPGAPAPSAPRSAVPRREPARAPARRPSF